MKELSFKTCYIVRCLYDLKGEQRVQSIAEALPLYDELAFLLQLMKDSKQISLNSFALLSEQIISVSRQLSILQRKATGPVPAE